MTLEANILKVLLNTSSLKRETTKKESMDKICNESIASKKRENKK